MTAAEGDAFAGNSRGKMLDPRRRIVQRPAHSIVGAMPGESRPGSAVPYPTSHLYTTFVGKSTRLASGQSQHQHDLTVRYRYELPDFFISWANVFKESLINIFQARADRKGLIGEQDPL